MSSMSLTSKPSIIWLKFLPREKKKTNSSAILNLIDCIKLKLRLNPTKKKSKYMMDSIHYEPNYIKTEPDVHTSSHSPNPSNGPPKNSNKNIKNALKSTPSNKMKSTINKFYNSLPQKKTGSTNYYSNKGYLTRNNKNENHNKTAIEKYTSKNKESSIDSTITSPFYTSAILDNNDSIPGQKEKNQKKFKGLQPQQKLIKKKLMNMKPKNLKNTSVDLNNRTNKELVPKLNLSNIEEKNMNNMTQNVINSVNITNNGILMNTSEIKPVENDPYMISEDYTPEINSFRDLKSDFDIFYSDNYIQGITADTLKLEYELCIDKILEIFLSYHKEFNLLTKKNEKYKKIYLEYSKEYLQINKQLLLFQQKKEKSNFTSLMNNYLKGGETNKEKMIVSSNTEELRIINAYILKNAGMETVKTKKQKLLSIANALLKNRSACIMMSDEEKHKIYNILNRYKKPEPAPVQEVKKTVTPPIDSVKKKSKIKPYFGKSTSNKMYNKIPRQKK